jgi:hypothetical protein
MKDKTGFYGIIEGKELFIEVVDMDAFLEEFDTDSFKQLIESIKTYTEQSRSLMNLMQQNVIKSTDSNGKNNTKQHTLFCNKVVFQNDMFLTEITKKMKKRRGE